MDRIEPRAGVLETDGQLTVPRQVKVWDLLVRIFHWTLVVSFTTGYLVTNKFPLHAYAGYIIFGLVVVRIVWGFVGTPYARFSAFTYGLRETFQYTIAALRVGHAREYLSHNPMGAVMVYALLAMLLANTVIGTMLYAAQQLEGPLEGIVPLEWDERLLSMHAIMAKALLSMAAFHLLGVLWATWWHRQNYILAMFTGYKSAFTRRSRRSGTPGEWSPEERARYRREQGR